MLLLILLLWAAPFLCAQPLPSAAPLTMEGDPAAQMVDGIVRYLERAVTEQAPRRAPTRERLRTILGVVDARVPFNEPDLVATTAEPALLVDAGSFRVLAVRWPVLDGLSAEGLLFQPKATVRARAVVLPGAGGQPEDLKISQELASAGVQVLSPALIGTGAAWSGNPKIGRMTKQPHREFVYRMAFEVGRHIYGYEVQKVLAAVDWFAAQSPRVPVGVWGEGEGGTVALFAAALDERIGAAAVAGSREPLDTVWRQPLYRNVFGLLKDFGEVELARMASHRRDLMEALGIPAAPALPPVVIAPRNASEREHRQFIEMVEYTQRLARESERVRDALWARTERMPAPEWTAAAPFYRDKLWDEVLGRLPTPTMPLNARSRKSYSGERWDGYEVLYDVYPDVIGYGVLLLPKDLQPGERRPVVVGQHGLEGRPQHLFARPESERNFQIYQNIGSRFADLGYIVYLPQNPYIGDFRRINRVANPLGLSMFSFILAQHDRLLDWLTSLPFVDPARIGFYGLSYGGKTAMRVPPLLTRYAVAVCSGDFNEWIYKNTTVDAPYSYMFTNEYEMPEFGLASVANYAEMAKMMAPRPFMVERGHRDGVGVDEWVAYEYAKVKRFYDEMGIGDRTAIEFFNGPHQIHGVGTVEFLRRYLGR